MLLYAMAKENEKDLLETLTDEELAERAALRTEYLAEIRASMTGILDNSVIVRPDGTREQVKDRKTSPIDGDDKKDS